MSDDREREDFSDEEFEKYLNQSGSINSLSSILAVREKTRSVIEMFKVETEAYTSIDDEGLKQKLRDHLTELMNNFKASMTQFDLKILDELGVDDGDNKEGDDI